MRFTMGMALVAAFSLAADVAYCQADYGKQEDKKQVLPLGPTTFQAGWNRDGYFTYVTHGYKEVENPTSKTGSISVPLPAVDLDHIQATLSMHGVTGGPVRFVSVIASKDGSNAAVSYELASDKMFSVEQMQFTLMIGTNQRNYAPLEYLIPPGNWACTFGCGCVAQRQAPKVRVESGRLRLTNECGNEPGGILPTYNPATRVLNTAQNHPAIGWGQGRFNDTFTRIEWGFDGVGNGAIWEIVR